MAWISCGRSGTGSSRPALQSAGPCSFARSRDWAEGLPCAADPGPAPSDPGSSHAKLAGAWPLLVTAAPLLLHGCKMSRHVDPASPHVGMGRRQRRVRNAGIRNWNVVQCGGQAQELVA